VKRFELINDFLKEKNFLFMPQEKNSKLLKKLIIFEI
jgi:hypothetical protein